MDFLQPRCPPHLRHVQIIDHTTKIATLTVNPTTTTPNKIRISAAVVLVPPSRDVLPRIRSVPCSMRFASMSAYRRFSMSRSPIRASPTTTIATPANFVVARAAPGLAPSTRSEA